MSRKGEVFTNPVTGERAAIRDGSEDGDDPTHAVVDLYVRPGGAVVGEHVHDNLWEGFEVISGSVGFRLDGEERIAGPGEGAEVPIGGLRATYPHHRDLVVSTEVGTPAG